MPNGCRVAALRAGIQILREGDRLARIDELHAANTITADELWDLLRSTYFDVNDPYKSCPNLLNLFRAAVRSCGIIKFANEDAPTVPVIAYRGSDEKGKRGLSWSTNREVARTFANQVTLGNIYVVEVQLAAILGVLRKAGEDELFVDYELIAEPEEVIE
ncbi:MAG: hypothetical protein IAI48_11960 [Candidatus Eremiobacteraeota bacterium]|nr:hypothetical protein [Candidatus Eremiobacteraeota bacterium]